LAFNATTTKWLKDVRGNGVLKMGSNSLFSFVRSETWNQMPARTRRFFLALLLIHFLLTAAMSYRTGWTADEPDYFSYAVRWAKGNTTRILPTDDSKSPIVAPVLLAIPLKKWLAPDTDPYGFHLLLLGRTTMYVFQAMGSFFFLLWFRRLFPHLPPTIPLLLYLFDPLVFCYGMIAGSDLPATALMLGATYATHRYCQSLRTRYWVWAAIFTGFAIVAKASMVYLLVLLPLMYWITTSPDRAKPILHHWKGKLQRAFLFGCLVLFIIHAAYLFQGGFFPFRLIPQSSQAFQKLATTLKWAGDFPVPLPYDFVSAYDLLSHNAEKGGGGQFDHSFEGVSIFQEYKNKGPVWYYYFIHFLFKTPIILQLGLLLAGIAVFRKRGKKFALLKYGWIWIPPLFYFCLLSLTNPFQIGIRHALMIFPFLYLMSAPGWYRLRRSRPILFAALIGCHVMGVAAYANNLLAYTNEWLWPKRSAWKILNDSSIAYGQSQRHLEHFLQQHAEYKRPGANLEPGKYALDAETLISPFRDSHLNWLKKGTKPAGHYAFTVILFHVSEADVQRVKAADAQR
jgi:hypothetical protein